MTDGLVWKECSGCGRRQQVKPGIDTCYYGCGGTLKVVTISPPERRYAKPKKMRPQYPESIRRAIQSARR